LFNSTVCVYGFRIDNTPSPEGMKKRVLSGAEATGEILGVDLSCSDMDYHMSFDYIGDGYDIPTALGTEAIKQVAREEAVILDPVYTGKAMAGLLDSIRTGEIRKGSRVLFWHTGGLPAVFAGEQITGAIYE